MYEKKYNRNRNFYLMNHMAYGVAKKYFGTEKDKKKKNIEILPNIYVYVKRKWQSL